jgi:hypothetical protein
LLRISGLITDQKSVGIPHIDPPSDLTWSGVVQLLKPVRKALDIIEPHHIRQFSSVESEPLWFLSYGFSVVKWGKAIRSIQPDLAHNISVIEFFHRHIATRCLRDMDTRIPFSRLDGRFGMTLILKILYEAVHSLKLCPTVDQVAVNGYLEALASRISDLCCHLLPAKNIVKKRERKHRNIQTGLLASFTKTSVLLPPEWQDCANPMDDMVVRRTQRRLSTPNLDLPISKPQQPSGPSESSFPCLAQYVPATFLSVFGFEADFFCQIGSIQKEDTLPDMTEDRLRKRWCTNGELNEGILDLAACALSITTKRLLDSTGAFPMSRQLVMVLIIASSVHFIDLFLLDVNMKKTKKGRTAWLETWPYLSASMYTWAEDSGYLTEKEEQD